MGGRGRSMYNLKKHIRYCNFVFGKQRRKTQEHGENIKITGVGAGLHGVEPQLYRGGGDGDQILIFLYEEF